MILSSCSNPQTIIQDQFLSPPPQYLQSNTRPRCDYNNNNTLIVCLESYKELADINDADKLELRKWVTEHSK